VSDPLFLYIFTYYLRKHVYATRELIWFSGIILLIVITFLSVPALCPCGRVVSEGEVANEILENSKSGLKTLRSQGSFNGQLAPGDLRNYKRFKWKKEREPLYSGGHYSCRAGKRGFSSRIWFYWARTCWWGELPETLEVPERIRAKVAFLQPAWEPCIMKDYPSAFFTSLDKLDIKAPEKRDILPLQ